jgi:hypothetical protein
MSKYREYDLRLCLSDDKMNRLKEIVDSYGGDTTNRETTVHDALLALITLIDGAPTKSV